MTTLTHSYTINEFYPAQPCVNVDISTTDGDYVWTVNLYYWLPLDYLFRVPTGTELSTMIGKFSTQVGNYTNFYRAKMRDLDLTAPTNASTIGDLDHEGDVPLTHWLTSLVSTSYMSPVNQFVVEDASGIGIGWLFQNIAYGYSYVTAVEGNTVSFSPALTFTPNFVVGTPIDFINVIDY